MTRKSAQLVLEVIFSLGVGVLSSKAANIMKSATADGLRIERF